MTTQSIVKPSKCRSNTDDYHISTKASRETPLKKQLNSNSYQNRYYHTVHPTIHPYDPTRGNILRKQYSIFKQKRVLILFFRGRDLKKGLILINRYQKLGLLCFSPAWLDFHETMCKGTDNKLNSAIIKICPCLRLHYSFVPIYNRILIQNCPEKVIEIVRLKMKEPTL